MRGKNQNMLQGPLFLNIVTYTVPIILTSLLQLLFNAADLVVVGQFCGSISVGAVGATGSITNLIVNLFIGFSVGAGVSVAHGIGSRDREMVHKTVHTALPLAVVCGVILTVIGISFAEPLLRLMGTPENVLKLSAVYMRIYFGGIVFSMVYNFSAAILRAAGDTKGPLIYLTIAGVLNVILNLIFVIVFHMNVAGVALATILSQGVSMVLVIRALMHRIDACKLRLKELRFHKAPLGKIVTLGLPAGIQGSLFSISNVIIQSSINSFGDIFISGSAAAANLEGFVYVCMNGFHQTALNFSGQNAGAGQYDRVRKILIQCLACVAVVGIATGGLVYLFAPKLLSIYITDSDLAISYGVLRMGFVCLPYFLLGLMDVTTGALRGIGSSFVPMLISVFGICGFRLGWIATVFQMPQYHTPEGLFISYPVTWVITLVAQLIAYFIVIRKRRALQ